MTHMRPMRDDEGEFASWKHADECCLQCGSEVEYRLWESHDGAYEDFQYCCTSCRYTWWVDGIDA
jgi:hypothetical protein